MSLGTKVTIYLAALDLPPGYLNGDFIITLEIDKRGIPTLSEKIPNRNTPTNQKSYKKRFCQFIFCHPVHYFSFFPVDVPR